MYVSCGFCYLQLIRQYNQNTIIKCFLLICLFSIFIIFKSVLMIIDKNNHIFNVYIDENERIGENNFTLSNIQNQFKFSTFSKLKECLNLYKTDNSNATILSIYGCPPKFELENKTMKTIIVMGFELPPLNHILKDCPQSNCVIHYDRKRWRDAQLLILTDSVHPIAERPQGQAWLALIYEPPPFSRILPILKDKINFTSTYRQDSTIYAPYGRYKPYNLSHNYNTRYKLPEKNYALNKTKLIAWLVSDCFSYSPRMAYAKSLSRYIQVDMFGKCGGSLCPKSNQDCFKLLRDKYKFYLAFENNLCQDYITEKFFVNSLRNNMIPIVMGSSIEEYQKIAPPHSFIHVDQFSTPKQLAQYLHYLNSNDTAYNEYFSWHNHGQISSWEEKVHCDFCLLAHSLSYLKPQWYPNFELWWMSSCKNRSPRWNPLNYYYS